MISNRNNDGAGPGAYYTPQPFESKAGPMTIPAKRERPHPDTTGPQVAPGGYDPDRGMPLTKPKSVSALIPKGQRPKDLAKHDSGPDPGAYEPATKFG